MEKTIRETSDAVCQALISKAWLTDSQIILEPSAGNGKIISFIEANYSFNQMQFDLVELNKEKAQHLVEIKKSNWNVFHKDFLQFENAKQYDRIIACPPFKGNVDIIHIQRMYQLLAKKGVIVSLTSPYWLTNNEAHQVEFRKWLTDKEYYLTMLPDNSFIEKERTVPTAILQIVK